MTEFFVLPWKHILEIAILWFFYYMLFLFIKGTRAVQVIKGLVILIIIFIITQELRLQILNWILTKIFTISVIAFLIIFQPELRRGLARIGQFGMFYKEKQLLDEIARSAMMLSKKKVGALIAVEREIGLKTYIESGVPIDSQVTSELINTIFMPNTPLHDGGIVVQGSRIVAAGCLFPLTQNPNISKGLGTRHRAAMGLSEETDAVVVIVSEETGDISISAGGRLTKNIEDKDVAKILNNIYRPKRAAKKSFFDLWNRIASRIGNSG